MDANGKSSKTICHFGGKNGRGMIAPAKKSAIEVNTIRTPCGESVKKVDTYTNMEKATVTNSPSINVIRNNPKCHADAGFAIP